ncbi:MAG: TrpB-like pyridoxal phosphate-dependent enzyme [Magnetococcales bacterium]|nr:TrpB-like pyridoxal phosphate-dependent enzyme [Magnetococcales bacterium]
MTKTTFLLEESEIPTHWYNVIPDLPTPPAPPLGPDGKPISPEALLAIFPEALIQQEMSPQRWIEIPEPVREIYALWRPAPLKRAVRLEKMLGTPAKIYYKYEGVSPAGSHKPNTAVPQAYYNKQAGIKRISTETGAGQWGSSMALAGQMFGLDVRVYMVKVSYGQKPFRRSMMETWGAEVFASPTNMTNAGRAALAEDPNNPGSLGLAISEAVEEAATNADTNYALGSVLNHVLLHQTVVGLESKKQFEKANDYPDIIIGCCGGGSNFAGTAFPFLADKAAGKDIRLIGVEPASCPTMTRGHYAYDYGDTANLTPQTLMYTLGSNFMPPSIHAGGLRYHGESALLSQLVHEGVIEARSVHQLETFEAGVTFAKAEGIIPAPESCHAVRSAMDEALVCKESGEEKTIFFTLSGHGHFDMASYDKYFAGELENYEYPEEAIKDALARLPKNP